MTHRIVVGITGASGAVYGVRLLEHLHELPVETHLIATKWACVTIEHEAGRSWDDVKALADVVYAEGDQSAAVSSGSFVTEGMVIAPCSMKTVAAIATGFASNLVCRAADVMLKERRRLVLMVRESPLNLAHLRNMVSATEMGAIVCPPMPAFYLRPQSVEDIVDASIARVLDLLNVPHALSSRWQGAAAVAAAA
jgi:flavin prenyltransferase